MKEVGGHPFAAAWGFVSGRLLGSHGCSCRGRGVLLGSYSINLFGVWDGCVKGLLVNICGGTAESGDMRVSTRQHADCAGGGVPFVCLFESVGVVFGRILFSTRLGRRWLDQVAMRGPPDNGAGAPRGTVPSLSIYIYIYIYIYMDFIDFWGEVSEWSSSSGGGSGVYGFEEFTVCVQF